MWGSSIGSEGRKRKGIIKGHSPFIVFVMDFAVNYKRPNNLGTGNLSGFWTSWVGIKIFRNEKKRERKYKGFGYLFYSKIGVGGEEIENSLVWAFLLSGDERR